ncbi:MAG: hypothetical protein DBY14_01885 [Escherichia coli]|nr:MAG: hypothetical protein DBY14_01885 [Escherichia coli]
MFKRLMPYMKGYWFLSFVSIVGMAVEAACELALPKTMAKIVDIGIVNGDNEYIIKMGVYMLILALVGLVGGMTAAKVSSVASQGFAYKIRRAMYENISSFSFKNIDDFSTASLTTRLTNDVTTIQNMVRMILVMLVRAPAMLVISAFYAFSINARLACVILAVLPIILIAVALVMKFGFPMFQKMQKKIDAINAVIQENLIGIRVVKAFVREDHEKEKFKKRNDDLTQMGIKAGTMIVTAMPVVMAVFDAAILIIVWLGGNQVGNGTMQIGDLLSFITYISQVLMSTMMFAMILLQVVRGKACAQRIGEVLETKSTVTNKENAIKADGKGTVEFKNVDFKYSEEGSGDLILSNINFKVDSGKVVGIVGSTGCGKSSLVSLIPRLYDVYSGQVLIDGVDVRDYDMESLRDMIGVVLQKNVLFSGTIKENIRWGKEDATDEEIIKACKASCADDFISSFPDGYDTYLAQGGLNLSGGQKQRLCIARAMIKKPKILILDDSTSAVDTATEARIRQSFKNELKDTTVFIIAQRISSVQDADEILVLDDGELKGIGTHEELLKNNEIYQEIVNTQAKGVGE